MLRNILPFRRQQPISVFRAVPLIRVPLIRQFAHIASEEQTILIEREKNARTFILNRPKQLNPIDLPSVNIFFPALKTFDESDNVDIMVLKGNGRALSAGGDVKFFINSATDPEKHPQLDYFLGTVYEMFHKLGTMKKPLITIMDGISMGYGLAVSTLVPFGVATENTKICMPETRFGHFCDVGSTFFLPRLNGHIGKYMALTAHVFQAEDAVLAGLATHFVPSDRLEDLEKALTSLHKPTHDIVNDTIEKFAVKSDHSYNSSALSKENRAIIASCFKYDTIEEILDALERDGSKFSKDTIQEINNGSPIGVKLTTELHRRVAGLSLQECLRLEHYLWQSSAVSKFHMLYINAI
ncbi:unnamed protein product [Mucor hiemalis]